MAKSAGSSKRGDFEVLEYSQMYVPSTMRSRYWQYFGFPSDNDNNILTKERIICIICNKSITYNKNTTNLRTHLIARHPDALYQLETESEKKPKVTSKTQQNEKRKKLRSRTDMKQVLRKITDPLEADEENSKMNEENVTIEAIVGNDLIVNEVKIRNRNEYHDVQPYQVEEIDCANMQPSQDTMNDALLDMLITNLLSPNFVESNSFVNFVYTISPNVLIPDCKTVKNILKQMSEVNSNDFNENIKIHSQKYSFSLSMEIWKNMEKDDMISIFVNYISPKENRNLRSVLYRTEYMSELNMQEVLKDLTLKNCSVAVVNCDHPILNDFLNSMDIVAIPCFSALIQKCARMVFEIPAVDATYNHVVKFLKELVAASEEDTFPVIHDEFPLTKLNILSYFYDKISNAYALWTDSTSELIDSAKELIDCLSPLKLTMETLSDEPIALASLLKPFTTKLQNEYFCSYNGDSDVVLAIKQIMFNELSSSILNNTFLLTTTFFDPRFLNYIDGENLEIVKSLIDSKFQHIIEDDQTECKKEFEKSDKRSSLKLFFKSDQFKRTPKPSKNTLDIEIPKYLSEICDIEQCPLAWWNETGYAYRQLKVIAESYICVPANVNNICKKSFSQQIEFFEKRLSLKGEIGKKMLHLYFNR